MFVILWYNGDNKKIHLGAELAARVRWKKIWSFASDHTFDHLRLRTTRILCREEHTKAVHQDAKAPKSP